MQIADLAARVVSDRLLRAYLVNRIPQAARSALERLYFASDALYERLGMVEQDLIDDYVCGRLNTRQRTRFEQSYATNLARRHKVDTAQELRAESLSRQVITTVAARQPCEALSGTRRRQIMAAAGVMLSLIIGIMFITSRRGGQPFVIVVPTTSAVRLNTDQTKPFVIPRKARTVRFEIQPRRRLAEYALTMQVNGAKVEPENVHVSAEDAVIFETPKTALQSGLVSIELRPKDKATATDEPEEYRLEIKLEQ